MQGQLLNYIVQDNKGYIVGDNGQRYQFSGNEWKENRIPTKGERLDFEVDASGQAKSVSLLLIVRMVQVMNKIVINSIQTCMNYIKQSQLIICFNGSGNA